mmetsp:Transcript_8873/g.28602  ORF Transcript_8873/g.28602 Transcript_8873/m.28602 type:complete len:215 (-) Transcript_8873:88-732(-)
MMIFRRRFCRCFLLLLLLLSHRLVSDAVGIVTHHALASRHERKLIQHYLRFTPILPGLLAHPRVRGQPSLHAHRIPFTHVFVQAHRFLVPSDDGIPRRLAVIFFIILLLLLLRFPSLTHRDGHLAHHLPARQNSQLWIASTVPNQSDGICQRRVPFHGRRRCRSLLLLHIRRHVWLRVRREGSHRRSSSRRRVFVVTVLSKHNRCWSCRRKRER